MRIIHKLTKSEVTGDTLIQPDQAEPGDSLARGVATSPPPETTPEAPQTPVTPELEAPQMPEMPQAPQAVAKGGIITPDFDVLVDDDIPQEPIEKAGPPRPGLVPQSGDPDAPVRWVLPPSEEGEEGKDLVSPKARALADKLEIHADPSMSYSELKAIDQKLYSADVGNGKVANSLKDELSDAVEEMMDAARPKEWPDKHWDRMFGVSFDSILEADPETEEGQHVLDWYNKVVEGHKGKEAKFKGIDEAIQQFQAAIKDKLGGGMTRTEQQQHLENTDPWASGVAVSRGTGFDEWVDKWNITPEVNLFGVKPEQLDKFRAKTVKEIGARIKESKGALDTHITGWWGTGPTNADSAPLHVMAERLRGGDPDKVLSTWQDPKTVGAQADAGFENFKQLVETEQAFWRDHIARSGKNTLTVYRGLRIDEPSRQVELGVQNTEDNTLSSWSMSPGTARTFGSTVLQREVQPEEIMGSYLGMLARGESHDFNEHELIIHTPLRGAEAEVKLNGLGP